MRINITKRLVNHELVTYEYAVNSPDIKLWAEQTDVFKLLLDDLTKEEVKLGDFIESTLKYVDIMENYIHDQEIINRTGSL